MDGYERLANAIVEQAAFDYQQALQKFGRNPWDESAQKEKQELEQFFDSDWFAILTNLDPVALLERMQREVG
jgi:hypothetical protein